uniref:Uncharacterized protein LOC100377997 n=1 Tax=Saccoglossus kowalevskii TaxID=10224 RepID=A0ABM0MXV1_SACKO|nr:PREDICTED: uncharacterized protein LOC100377997 [Saccoglossus kowalevskii]
MSQKYKDSSMCRTEATYSFKLQKTIIPLMVEPNYSPDGWLGALLGTTLYFNFCAEDDLEVVISKILEKVQFIMPSSFQVTSLSNPSTTKPEDAPQALVTSWSSDNVHEWLCQNDLEDMSNHFTVYNGEMLIQMKKLSHQAPEFFYKSLKTDVGFQDLYTILKFAKALDKLVI